MFNRPHHQRIAGLLKLMNADFLRETKCFFGGGTAIALLLGEYRESVDIDFLCSDHEGYRKLRTSVFDHGLNDLFTKKVDILREVRADRDGIRTFLVVDGKPIKFEIVREGRIEIEGKEMPGIPVTCLSKIDLFAEKLLANADRFADKSVMSRDAIDLLIMEKHWGQIPHQAWTKATGAYGDSVHGALKKAKDHLRDNPQYLTDCISKMGIGTDVVSQLRQALGLERSKSPGFGR